MGRKPVKNGETVKRFEEEFAACVGARFAIALNSGTSTLHTALVALGVKPGQRVVVPPLTMSATSLAVLHAGAVPEFCDVHPDTWLMNVDNLDEPSCHFAAFVPVSLYGLHQPYGEHDRIVDDAAQTLRKHGGAAFTSYSTQYSKILSTGEGGLLVTDSEDLAASAREFSSLGYRMRADQPRIDPVTLKSPAFDRHHSIGWNYRMNDITAAEGLRQLARADDLLMQRHSAAGMYWSEIQRCEWLTAQDIPWGHTHDHWTYAVACDTPQRAIRLADAIVKHGGERPYPCWRITYAEPAFRHLDPGVMAYGRRESPCPIAEDLQPRLLQLQTNSLSSAERNASALRKAIEEVG